MKIAVVEKQEVTRMGQKGGVEVRAPSRRDQYLLEISSIVVEQKSSSSSNKQNRGVVRSFVKEDRIENCSILCRC